MFMMRKDHKGSLYALKYKDNSGSYYVIMNLTTMQEWTMTHPVNYQDFKDPFITIQQFKKLCRAAGVKFEDMMPIPKNMLDNIYNQLTETREEYLQRVRH